MFTNECKDFYFITLRITKDLCSRSFLTYRGGALDRRGRVKVFAKVTPTPNKGRELSPLEGEGPIYPPVPNRKGVPKRVVMPSVFLKDTHLGSHPLVAMNQFFFGLQQVYSCLYQLKNLRIPILYTRQSPFWTSGPMTGGRPDRPLPTGDPLKPAKELERHGKRGKRYVVVLGLIGGNWRDVTRLFSR